MTKRQSISAILLILTFIATNLLFSFTAASAQGVATLGEIQTSGNVFIESSNGKWMPSGKTYPLLQGTAIKTEEGSASIHFRDGSRVAMSKNTMALIDGVASHYTIRLVQGVLAFNISPASALTVSTASADVYVNDKKGIVQKTSQETSAWHLGAVSVNERGTDIKSISGKIFVNVSASDTKLIPPGESMLIGSDGKHNVYKTQAITKKGVSSDYLIQKGDLLEIKTEGFEGIYKVDSKGRITLPSGIDFHVEGLTTTEAEKMIAKGLAKSLDKTTVALLEKQKLAAVTVPASTSGEKIAAIVIGASQTVTVGVLSGFVVFRGNRHASPFIP